MQQPSKTIMSKLNNCGTDILMDYSPWSICGFYAPMLLGMNRQLCMYNLFVHKVLINGDLVV